MVDNPNKKSKGKKQQDDGDDAKKRIAIVNKDKCKPKKCGLQCKKACPVNQTGQVCINVNPASKQSEIAEILCIGCNQCVRKCPFGAIQIINLPKDLSKDVTHRFGQNQFKLHRLPLPRVGQVLGLVGTNGIGKSTALKILANKGVVPNLGRYQEGEAPSKQEICKYFGGSELQKYFTDLYENQLVSYIKPQFVDDIPKQLERSGKTETVGELIKQADQLQISEQLIEMLDFKELLDRQYKQLSGGELQRFAILLISCKKGNVYIYDEPTSYLDIRQRINAAKLIRQQLTYQNESNTYVIVVEHDLSILDYLSDFINCFYGVQSIYGIVSMPFSVREGINIFLDGFIPTENMRFRDYSISFRITQDQEEQVMSKRKQFPYPDMQKKWGNSFILDVKAGQFSSSEIIVLLGQNGCGKTTFIQMLAGKDEGTKDLVPELNVSLKPQIIDSKWEGSVRDLLHARLKNIWEHAGFVSDVTKPMLLEEILDNQVQELSGGERQRVAIILALGKPADVCLIDEPSAYLDSEQRIIAARVIKRHILNSKKACFVVEHDFIMATYLADSVIVYEGEPGKHCVANTPQSLIEGMNKFLAILTVTFRRDRENFRPRINKANSEKDREQTKSGDYFCVEK